MAAHNPGLGTDKWYLAKTQGYVVFCRITEQCRRMERVISSRSIHLLPGCMAIRK